MRLAWRVVAIIAVAAVVASLGCGKGHKQTPSAPTVTGDVPLPEWAPENPSPEFLRAAEVLQPIPDEALQRPGAPPGLAAAFQRYRDTMAASYEFFGTLDDHQIERFSTTKEIRIPVRSLTARQRAALNRWFDNWRTVMEGTGLKAEDWLVYIYKMGGREDLSNVDVGFRATGGGHAVHIYFWVRMPDGTVNEFGTAFATI